VTSQLDDLEHQVKKQETENKIAGYVIATSPCSLIYITCYTCVGNTGDYKLINSLYIIYIIYMIYIIYIIYIVYIIYVVYIIYIIYIIYLVYIVYIIYIVHIIYIVYIVYIIYICSSAYGPHVEGFRKHLEDIFGRRPTGTPIRKIMKDIREKYEEIKKKLHTSKPNGKDGKEQQQLFHAAYHMVSILEVIAMRCYYSLNTSYDVKLS